MRKSNGFSARQLTNSDLHPLLCGVALIVSTEMPEDAWLIGYLLTFGTQVDIIEPLYLKEVLAEQARKIYEKNKP